jgi:hypothetical protein
MSLDIYVGYQNMFVMSAIMTVFRIGCDIMPESQNNLLTENGQIAMFLQQQINL